MVNLTAAERVYEYWIDKASSAADLVPTWFPALFLAL